MVLQRASSSEDIHLKYQCKHCTISIFVDHLIVGAGRIDIALRSVDDSEWIPTESENTQLFQNFQ